MLKSIKSYIFSAVDDSDYLYLLTSSAVRNFHGEAVINESLLASKVCEESFLCGDVGGKKRLLASVCES